jgi:cytochrome d ubiquinol oxidase subunit I
LYAALGITTIVVLRRMSRRFRAQHAQQGFDDADVPYGPSAPVDADDEVPVP